MRKEIMVMGLVGLLGCDYDSTKYNVSQVNRDTKLDKPAGCETIKDIRLELGHGSSEHYQVLCSDKEGNLTLYNRHYRRDAWEKITIR